METYILIVNQGLIYKLFPKKWLFKENKKIFCAKDAKDKNTKNNLFVYRSLMKDVYIFSSVSQLFCGYKKEMLKEKKHDYFRKKARFEICFWNGGFFDWYAKPKITRYDRRKLLFVERKIMTFGSFLKYFAEKSKKIETSTEKPKTAVLFWHRVTNPAQERIKKGTENIINKLESAISLLKDGKTVHTTKLMPLIKLGGHTNIGTEYRFLHFLVKKSFEYFINGQSLFTISDECLDEKRKVLESGLSLIEQTFANPSPIDTRIRLKELYDYLNVDREEDCFSRGKRGVFIDPDILVLLRALLFFAEIDRYQVRFVCWIAARYYCLDYQDTKLKLKSNSIQRLEDILGFVKNIKG